MAGKKTAVFGIYPRPARRSAPSTRSCSTASRTLMSPCCCRTTRAEGLRAREEHEGAGRHDDRRRGRRHDRRNVGSARGHRRAGDPGPRAVHRRRADHGRAGRTRRRRRGRRDGRRAVGMGIPEYEAKRYEGRVKNGGMLLSVHCDTSDEITRAKDILKRTGAKRTLLRRGKRASAHPRPGATRETRTH